MLVGGQFNTIDGKMRRLALLDATTGGADTIFNPNTSGIIFAIAVQSDGKILVGGNFFNIGGQPRSNIARLDPTTAAADSFNPNADSNVFAIAVQSDGKILIGGLFTNVGGQNRLLIARLSATTGLADSFNPSANGSSPTVSSIAVQSDGKILVGGKFGTSGGQTRHSIVRLDPTTGTADSCNPDAGVNGTLSSITIQSDGKILVGGSFTAIGGQVRNSIARLDSITCAADSFDPNANFNVSSIAVQPDGKVLLGGSFTTIFGVTRNRIARLNTDGSLEQTLNLSTLNDFVFATAIQPDGKLLIGGDFTTIFGVARNRIARLNTDGSLDSAFDPNANGTVNSIAVQPDGKILAGGQFTTIGGQTRNLLARLDATTGAPDSFNPNATGGVTGGINFPTVFSIAVQSDGKIVAGGNFFNIGGQTRNYIARLDGTTGLADSFDPNSSGIVKSVAVQSNGKVLAGGQFTAIGGQVRNSVARLDATTGIADSFDPNANGGVLSLALQSDGKVLVGGVFTMIGGQPRNLFARLDGTTGLADSFDPNANGTVNSIAVQSDGKVLVGGVFTIIGGQSRNLFARLTNDTAAISNVVVTQTTVTWTRNGSAPQLTRATFEISTDNGATYTSLGNATPSLSNPLTVASKNDANQFAPTASGYTLTGLNLMTGQNVLVRARGYFRAGYQSGSETTTQNVQNAFLTAAPTAASVSIGGRVLTPEGRGLRNAVINLTDANGQTRTARTSTFGYYRFEEVGIGQDYILEVRSKQYQFEPRFLLVVEELNDLNLVAQP